MNNTFDTVDEKVAETEFFLRKMAEVQREIFEFKCYFSAYLSAARTTTLALQQFKHIPGFEQWYEPHRKKLQDNQLAKFFLDMRNEHVHGGQSPVSAKSGEIAQLNRSMPHSGREETLVKNIVHQVCGMLRFARSFL